MDNGQLNKEEKATCIYDIQLHIIHTHMYNITIALYNCDKIFF